MPIRLLHINFTKWKISPNLRCLENANNLDYEILARNQNEICSFRHVFLLMHLPSSWKHYSIRQWMLTVLNTEHVSAFDTYLVFLKLMQIHPSSTRRQSFVRTGKTPTGASNYFRRRRRKKFDGETLCILQYRAAIPCLIAKTCINYKPYNRAKFGQMAVIAQ